MKLRIISDLHIDVNKDYMPTFIWTDKDILTVIAGDTAGSLEATALFIRAHFNNAILVGGNHIVYNYEHKTIQQLHDDYRKEFPLGSTVSYLENNYKVIDNVVFIGATLWTDYQYKLEISENMWYAASGLNDFRWGNFAEADGKVVPLQPRHCRDMFNESLAFIKTVYDQFADTGKKIVLVVHHAVSPKAINKQYKHSLLNASFVSDLEVYIKTDLPKLSLIVHGHVHSRHRYKIKNIPVVCNPYGYINYGEHAKEPSWNKDLIIEI